MASRRNMRITLVAMTVSSSMILVDQTAVPPAAPHAIIGLHAQISHSQWLMTANILPPAALMVFGGRLGDLFGMRRVFLFGAGIFALATTAMGASPGLAWAIAARAVQGTGVARRLRDRPRRLGLERIGGGADRRPAAAGARARHRSHRQRPDRP